MWYLNYDACVCLPPSLYLAFDPSFVNVAILVSLTKFFTVLSAHNTIKCFQLNQLLLDVSKNTEIVSKHPKDLEKSKAN